MFANVCKLIFFFCLIPASKIPVDQWFASTLCSLTLNKQLFQHVVPEGQSFTYKYAGIFHFRIWQFGKWIDVVVDDRLPCRPVEQTNIYSHSVRGNDFWIPLLEKAIAKNYGSYTFLQTYGKYIDLMTDLTGGLKETHSHLDTTFDVYDILLQSEKNGAIMAGVTGYNKTNDQEGKKEFARNHVYSIIELKEIVHDGNNIRLLKLKDPGGQNWGWVGSWSEGSVEWKNVSEEKKIEMEFYNRINGEFWMTMNDYFQAFDKTLVCSIHPSFTSINKEGNNDWFISTLEGSWIIGKSAGGNPYLKTTHMNPQFRIDLLENDHNHENCTVVIGLMQEIIGLRTKDKPKLLDIGFAIFRVFQSDVEQNLLGPKFFKENRPMNISQYMPSREITRRFKIPKGHYVILPTTDNPRQANRFLLRIRTEKNLGINLIPKFEVAPQHKDLSFSLVMPEEIVIGRPARLSLKVYNVGKVCNYVTMVFFGAFAKGPDEKYIPIKAKRDVITVPKLSGGETKMSIDFQEYGHKIQTSSKLYVAYQVLLDDKKMIFSGIREIIITKPKLKIEIDGDLFVGKKCFVKASFKNPLPVSVEQGVFNIHTRGILDRSVGVKMEKFRPYSQVLVRFGLVPASPGTHTLGVSFSAPSLGKIEGSKVVEFRNSSTLI